MTQTIFRRTAVAVFVLAVAACIYGLWRTETWPDPVVQAAASYPPKNGDPCTLNMRVSVPINLTAGGKLISGKTGANTYICSLHLVSALAQNIALVEGTGTVCATGVAGMEGGSTAATGWNLAANQAVTLGMGSHWIVNTATATDDVCLLLSGAGQTSGSIQYVQQ